MRLGVRLGLTYSENSTDFSFFKTGFSMINSLNYPYDQEG